MALADFIAPIGGPPDWIGGFAVTAGHGELEIAARFKAAGDDYSAILAAALADRLAEAFAEALHHQVRTELWGYAPDEPFDLDALIAEKYRGIRPAPGYPGPARPHREARPCSSCWTPSAATGIELTESFAMTPPAVGLRPLLRPSRRRTTSASARSSATRSRTTPAARAGTVATAERWLAPILNYEPTRAAAA